MIKTNLSIYLNVSNLNESIYTVIDDISAYYNPLKTFQQIKKLIKSQYFYMLYGIIE